jgi:hypothetical protein
MTIKKFHWEMKEPIMFDSFEDIPDTLGWLSAYMIFDLSYGNLAHEFALMTAFGISADNVIINVVEMIQADMTNSQIINELKSELADSGKFSYFVSTYGTYTLFDTIISNVFELHVKYNSEDFKYERSKIEFYQYVTDSITKTVEAKIKSNYRPAFCAYWNEDKI